jgi:hypothetical protein
MEEILKQLLDGMNEIKQEVKAIDHSIGHLDQRLARLEKMDSIEHYVSVNQIDITDIKEIVEKIRTFQREELCEVSEFIKNNMKGLRLKEEIHLLHNRLDAQLMKIAQNEEALLILTKKSEG